MSVIDELRLVYDDLMDGSRAIVEMQNIMNHDIVVTKLSDVDYLHDVFWSTDKYIRIDPDVSYIKNIISKFQ